VTGHGEMIKGHMDCKLSLAQRERGEGEVISTKCSSMLNVHTTGKHYVETYLSLLAAYLQAAAFDLNCNDHLLANSGRCGTWPSLSDGGGAH